MSMVHRRSHGPSTHMSMRVGRVLRKGVGRALRGVSMWGSLEASAWWPMVYRWSRLRHMLDSGDLDLLGLCGCPNATSVTLGLYAAEYYYGDDDSDENDTDNCPSNGSCPCS